LEGKLVWEKPGDDTEPFPFPVLFQGRCFRIGVKHGEYQRKPRAFFVLGTEEAWVEFVNESGLDEREEGPGLEASCSRIAGASGEDVALGQIGVVGDDEVRAD
jgi:hypothetical protein